MKLLLDTHVFLWWCLDAPELSAKYLDLLTRAEERGDRLHLSVMSLWEISKLVSLKKFEISFSLDQWFQELEEDPQFQILPLNGRVILESTRLGTNFPKDPVDQLIAATARCYGLHLLTVDQRILESGMVAIT